MEQQPKDSTFFLFKHQVSGKAPKLVTSDNKTVLKCFVKPEYEFYNYFNKSIHISLPQYSLVKYLPSFKGEVSFQNKPEIEYKNEDENKDMSVWLQHVHHRYQNRNQNHKFIVLSNFVYGYPKPNILDIKIGGRGQKPQKITKSVSKYKIKLNGMIKTSTNNEKQFISKYIHNNVTDYNELKKYVAYFFNSNNKLKANHISIIIEELKYLVLALRSVTGWKLTSTSVCFIYDTDDTLRPQLKYIDFGRAFESPPQEQAYDEDTSVGLENIIKIMTDILGQHEKFDKIVIEKSEMKVVPKQKLMKYGSQKEKNEQSI